MSSICFFMKNHLVKVTSRISQIRTRLTLIVFDEFSSPISSNTRRLAEKFHNKAFPRKKKEKKNLLVIISPALQIEEQFNSIKFNFI